MKTYWQEQIEREYPELRYDPRHIEAYIRIAHATLDGLTLWQFRREILIAAACVTEGGVAAAERCAQSFGL